MPRIEISIPEQSLALIENGREVRRYAVSTSRNGAGEKQGSFCTPRGEHIVRAKIGAGQPLNAVFVRRRPTGEIWTPELAGRFPGRDWILTRILWLSGCEPGKNRLGDVDTMRRYIYIHGSPDAVEMGKPGSIGCVRMRNRDIVELYDVPVAHAYTPDRSRFPHLDRVRAAVDVDAPPHRIAAPQPVFPRLPPPQPHHPREDPAPART